MNFRPAPSLGISFGLLTCLLVGCGDPAATGNGGNGANGGGKDKSKGKPVPVHVATARVADVPRTLTLVGRTEASEVVDLHPQVTATVMATTFTEGGTVKAGAPLVSLDERAFATALTTAEANLAKAKASELQAAAQLVRDRSQLVFAEADAQRQESLVAQNFTTTHDLELARTAAQGAHAVVAGDEAAAATAQAESRVAEAAVTRARLDLTWCTVTAPISGTIGAAGLTTGNLAIAGQTVLATIVRMQPMYVGFSLPAAELPGLRATPAGEQLTVAVTPEGTTKAVTGVLEFIDNRIATDSATVRLRATCANQDSVLWPGQQCRIELTLGIDRQVLTIPAAALQASQQGALVWVIGADQTATPRPVTVARTWNGQAVITAGLTAGEVVVTEGKLLLVAGSTVDSTTPAQKDGSKTENKGPGGDSTTAAAAAPRATP